MLLLDNHIDISQYLIKWSVITKAYNTDNGEFYTKYMYNLYISQRISKKLLAQISLQKLSVLCLFIFYFFWPTDYLQVLSSKYKWLCATYKICIYIHVVNWVSTAGARKSAKFDTQKRLKRNVHVATLKLCTNVHIVHPMNLTTSLKAMGIVLCYGETCNGIWQAKIIWMFF